MNYNGWLLISLVFLLGVALAIHDGRGQQLYTVDQERRPVPNLRKSTPTPHDEAGPRVTWTTPPAVPPGMVPERCVQEPGQPLRCQWRKP
jgi:hypothetical protein